MHNILSISTHLHYPPQDFADRASGEKGLVEVGSDAGPKQCLGSWRAAQETLQHAAQAYGQPAEQTRAAHKELAGFVRTVFTLPIYSLDNTYTASSATYPLLHLPPLCPPHVRRGCAQPSALHNYRILARCTHSACCRIPRIFCQGCMSLHFLFVPSPEFFHPITLRVSFCLKKPRR